MLFKSDFEKLGFERKQIFLEQWFYQLILLCLKIWLPIDFMRDDESLKKVCNTKSPSKKGSQTVDG